MGSIFKFKQFEVNQAGCAMKINTDGVFREKMTLNKYSILVPVQALLP